MTNEEFERRYGEWIVTDHDRAYYWGMVRGSEALRDRSLELIARMRERDTNLALRHQ